MANINSITSNSYSSTSNLYGNRNVLTGLASGMDTETMIQNSVSGYQTKITELQQSTTKLEWKQDAYRELIDQMYNIDKKYTSYTSATNLSSNAFFTSAMTTTAQGSNASAISATGTAKSDIQIDAVKSLATSARYAVEASALSVNAASSPVGTAIDWSNKESIGQISGTMTLMVGSTSIDLKFTEGDKYENMSALVDGIKAKLAETSVNRKGESVKADSLVAIGVDDNKITFSAKGSSGDAAYIDSISGNLATILGASKPASTNIDDKMKNNSFTVPDATAFVKSQTTAEYLSGKLVDVSLDGVNKQVQIGDLTQVELPDLSENDAEIARIEEQINAGNLGIDESAQLKSDLADAQNRRAAKLGSVMNEALAKDLQASIDKQFGKGKVTVSVKDGGLAFDVAAGSGSTIKVFSASGEKLGLGKTGVSNYFNTSKTLGELLSSEDLSASRMKAAEGTIRTETDSSGKKLYYDSEGNRVSKYANEEEGQYYRVNEEGEFLYGLTINGTEIGGFTKDTAIERVMTSINSNVDVGVNVSYSNLTSQFVFTARETGEGGKISFDSALAKTLFTDQSSNAPTDKKASDLFGDSIVWDKKGYAELEVGTNSGYKSIGWVNKDDTVASLMEKLGSAYFTDLFKYDEETKTYGFRNSAGEEMSDSVAAQHSINAVGNRDSKIDFNSIAQNANSMRGFTAGTDAVVEATVNGKQLSLKRSSNLVEMDGMSVTLKNVFDSTKADGGDAVTFKTSSNADEIVDTIKSFVEDVNKLMTDVHSAYATQPAEKSTTNHTRYEPLTDDDKKDMSESAIKAYEEKAKQGLLFGDTDLSNLYSKLRDAIQAFGSDRIDMESIGLSTTYSNGVTQIKLNEKDLRSALENNPDKVRSVFTKTKEGGAASNGLMANIKATLNTYGSTSIGSPGVLVRKAGTKLGSGLSLLNNNLQKQIDNVNNQIESWQTKLSSKIDYYTKQFAALEKLMSTMNNQSSMLADLMGY